MPKSRKWINLAIVALFVAFGYGTVRLYLLRFTAGDVYPPYSSYRADPVGTRAFYESLDSLRGLSVERHAKPFSPDSVSDTIGNRASTWMFVGADASVPDYGPLDIVLGIERITHHGGRVVIAYMPTWQNLREEYQKMEAGMERVRRMRERRQGRVEENEGEEAGESEKESDENTPAESGESEPSDEVDSSEDANESDEPEEEKSFYEDLLGPSVELNERWGARLEFDPVELDSENKIVPQEARLVADANLPETVTWHTATWFGELSDEWRVLYERDEKPVVIERPFGSGSLVFASDSYFLSNEALRDERHPTLLTRMIGSSRLIVFEESHLGMARVPGVMTLVRGYGLYSVFWALIGLAALYLWKNAVPFVPPYEDETPADARHAAGRDSAAGFANLICRSVSPRKLLRTCLDQYKHSLGARQQDLAQPIQEMEFIAARENQKPASEWNPASAYRAMCRVLKEHLRG